MTLIDEDVPCALAAPLTNNIAAMVIDKYVMNKRIYFIMAPGNSRLLLLRFGCYF